MNTQGDVAEEIVRLSIEGMEVAMRLSGEASKNIAVMIYTIMKDKKMSKGKTRLTNLLKTGKELKIFALRRRDLEKFSEEAKHYGILYCALFDHKDKDPNSIVDIMVKSEDAPRVNRIVEKFNLSTVEIAKAETEKEQAKEKKLSEKEIESKFVDEAVINDLMGEATKEKQTTPSNDKTVENYQLENSSNTKEEKIKGTIKEQEKPSVRKEIKSIKEQMKKEETKDNLKQEKNKNATTKQAKHMKTAKHMKLKKERSK